jgi:hypothetical protein
MNVVMSVVPELLLSMSPANRLGFLLDGVDSRASRPTQCLHERPEVRDRHEGPSQLARCRPRSTASIGSWLIEKTQETDVAWMHDRQQ